MLRKQKAPTFTSIFEAWMQRQDDFVTQVQIREGTGLNGNRVSACLSHFFKLKMVDFIVSDGVTYWFNTGSPDPRTYAQSERTPEEPGTRKPRGTGRVRVRHPK